MTAFVVFPDAEIALLDYLRSVMPSLVCDVEIPQSYRANDGVFVCIRRMGGQANYPVSDYPMYDIEAYGPTRDAASDALGLVLAHLAVARRLPPVTGAFGRLAIITGPQYVEDPTTKEPRWQSLVSLPLRPVRVP